MGCERLMNDCNLYWSVPGALSSVVLRPHTVKKERAYHFSRWRGDHFHTSLGSRFPKAAPCPLLICCFSCWSGFSSTSTALASGRGIFHATARWIMLRGGMTHNVLLFYSQVFSLFKPWSNASGGLQSSLFIQWPWPFCLLVLVPRSCFSHRSKCKTLFVLTYGGFASPRDFDLHLFCSGSLHSLRTWRPSTPRSILTTSSFMSSVLFPLRTPKFSVASQESPIFFFSPRPSPSPSPQPLVVSHQLPFRLSCWGSCSGGGGQTRATHGSVGRQRARSVMELWVAGKQIFISTWATVR